MAIYSLQWVRSLSNSNPPTYDDFFEGDSVDAVAGEPVYLTSGFMVKRSANTQIVLGLIDEPAANSATAETDLLKKRVQIISLGQVYIASISAAGATANVAQTDVGVAYGIIESSVTANKWVINRSETTNTSVRVLKNYDAIGAVDGRVEVTFLYNEITVA